MFRRPKITPRDEMFRELFARYLPPASLDYVMDLWKAYPFYFKVARSRKTCLGNYMYRDGSHHISVNGDANPYGFLITLIHEIAHQRVKVHQRFFQRTPAPHGDTWKKQFQTLMAPLLHAEVFPEKVLQVLRAHMQDPAASTVKDPNLVKVLAEHSPDEKGIFLADLPDGEVFSFKGRRFQRIQSRRTRILVECTSTQRRYTIPGIAKVEP